MQKIVIIAGDKSGDLYGGILAKKLGSKFSKVKIFSFAGPSLAQHSQQVINLLEYSVCGLVEVLSSLRQILKIFNKTVKEIEKIQPDLIILIDFPDFNLKLAKTLNKKYPIFYYISPQIWAWRKNRIKKIKEYINKMVVIFDFEKEFYEKENMDAYYFGHPLLEIIDTKKDKTKNIISFLPGSRKNEIKKHLPIIEKTKNILQSQLPNYQFQIIRPSNIAEDFYHKFSNMSIKTHSYQAIAESKFIIASSGTATVEIAILGVPYLIIYKVNALTWQILKKLVNTKFIGMVNILSSKKIIDELLQKDATPKKIASTTLSYIKNPQKYQELEEKLKNVKEILSPEGATDKFSDFIGQYLSLS